MPFDLCVERLGIRGFRNISGLAIDLAPKINVISGDNGQGKTSVLEALYFLATSRSFRTDKIKEVCQEGSSLSAVDAKIREGGQARKQQAGIIRARHTFSIDEKKPESMSSYATRTPIVVFHPGDLSLVSGGATIRRRLLDRISLYLFSTSTDTRLRYQRAQKARQSALLSGGIGSRELEVYEHVLSQYGVQWFQIRSQAVAALSAALKPAFAQMVSDDLELELHYEPGGTDDLNRFKAELLARRAVDLRRKSMSFGPHRDDLGLILNGRSARRHASQGQQRILTLALKVAELDCVRTARGAHPLLLLDDVSSELDPTRTGAVYEFIRRSSSQVFVTTTRPELFTTPGLTASERADFKLQGGQLIQS